MWRQLPHTSGEERAHILLELAQEAIYRSSGEEALALAEEARLIYAAMGATAPTLARARAIEGVSSALKQLHREREAADLLQEAIELEHEGGFEFITDTLRTQGFYYCQASEFDLGIASLLEAARIDKLHGCDEFLAIDLYNAGCAYFDSGRHQQALETFLRAREIFRKRKDLAAVSRTDRFAAECFLATGDSLSALKYAGTALDIATLRHDAEIECKAMLSQAKAHMLLNDLAEVSNSLRGAEYLASSSTDWNLILEIQNEYRILAINENRFSDADEIAARIATIREILE